MSGSDLEVDGHRIALTHLDRVLYPDGTRKYDVIAYYLAIADAMLPHLASRPVTRKRWPSGTEAAPFFEKTLPAGTPDWVPRFTIAHSEGEKSYPVATSSAVLVWFAQVSALELHVPQWRIDLSAGHEDGRTDRLVLDLDPGPDVPLTQCGQVALTIRDVLTDAGLPSWPVTSGGKGIHVYAQLPSPVSADSARTVAKQIAVSLEKAFPRDVTASMSKAARPGKVFLDWSQNSASKTTLSPYSLRGLTQPWVAAPREWSELAEPDLAQLRYSEVLERFSQSGDLLGGATAPPTAPPAEPVADLPAGVVDLGVYRRRRAAPMLAVDQPIDALDSDTWAFEGKWDGYRVLATVRDGRLRLHSRSGNDLTGDFSELAPLAQAVPGGDMVLDGEVVALDADGKTDFGLLSSRRRRTDGTRLEFFVFDVLELDGRDLTGAPWDQRRRVLEELRPALAALPNVQIPDLLPGPGARAVTRARDMGWEGVVAKRRSAPYRLGTRSPDWRKQKNWNNVEVVIGGFRLGRDGANRTLGSVLVGLPAETGLRYVGRVGTGWTQAQAADLLAELRTLTISRSPFLAVDAPVASSATWVLPKLVVDVQFMNWTSTGHLRHPSWRGIRRDKLPGDVDPAGSPSRAP
ncbi:non-homologous end-joining DNA ligase [Gordonia alkaliphila]|uniref:non-homologous end-joining DNA ligase n=1 Tax=Gordonia alkaliphila TaxID=1053547 RepID=UPI001FF183B5|nr:non-homologous end-joining DNA ligase [Gordonia alkaliphila]MCK0438896.1 non-homologous end-joining DNA ligase [Gordonia alkaliphila]